MKIIWSDFAADILKEIYTYHKTVASIEIARKIKTSIFATTNQLISQPELGPLELSLLKINEGHRYLVDGNYKIVYKQVIEGILITDIFDVRQDPIKINDIKRKLKI